MNKIKKVFFTIVESFIRNIGGGLGWRIRYLYYKKRFKKCGMNVRIGVGVIIQGSEYMTIGNNVWIDDYCILIAGLTGDMSNRELKVLKNKNYLGDEGNIYIGNNVHFAPYCLIHGFGGVKIDDFVGFSSGVKVYSMSNHYQSFEDKNKVTYCNPMVNGLPVVFLKSPIVIEKNVFISINSIILLGTIGENSFIAPMSLVSKNIPKNSIANGNPALKIKNRFLLC